MELRAVVIMDMKTSTKFIENATTYRRDIIEVVLLCV